MTRTSKCIHCNKRIFGRADKKYCSSTCRNNFNNNRNKKTQSYIRKVNRILALNRKILLNLSNNQVEECDVGYLSEMGFNERFYTHSDELEDRSRVFYCYELGFAKERNVIRIIEKANII